MRRRRRTWIGRITRAEWSAIIGVVCLTVAIGSAIWRRSRMAWPLSGDAWFTVLTSSGAVALVAYAAIAMGREPPTRAPSPAASDSTWRWSSIPTSSSNSASAPRIGFRVSVVEAVDAVPAPAADPGRPPMDRPRPPMRGPRPGDAGADAQGPRRISADLDDLARRLMGGTPPRGTPRTSGPGPAFRPAAERADAGTPDDGPIPGSEGSRR